jgi:hypothetical protein
MVGFLFFKGEHHYMKTLPRAGLVPSGEVEPKQYRVLAVSGATLCQ